MVEILENLSQEVSDYKDTNLLLKNARKNYQLVTLYDEARQLFHAEQWLAVVKILDRITTIKPDFKDSDNLLPDAQKKVAELNRRIELDGLYSRGIQEMDLGNWGKRVITSKPSKALNRNFWKQQSY